MRSAPMSSPPFCLATSEKCAATSSTCGSSRSGRTIYVISYCDIVCRCLPSGVRPILYAAADAASRTSRKEIARMIARQARTVYHSRFRRDKEGHPSYFGLLPSARATLACKAAPIADSNRYRMKPAAWFGTAALALAAALAVPACSLLQGHGPVQVGKALPRLTFVALDGSQQPLVPPPGRITFVNVFATWCPPCKAEMPDLVAFASREARYGVDVIGIDQEETAAQVE